MSNHRTLAFAAVASLATLGLVGGATTTSSADADGFAPHVGQRVAAKATAPVKCGGGALKKMTSRLSAEPFSFAGTAGADVAVTGAQVALTGPPKGTDTVLVTFTAESYYTGSGWMSLELHKDGVPAAPYADNGSPFAFTSEASYHGDSAQFCTKIGTGTHVLAIQASTTGNSSTDSGWIDDWTMSVPRFE
ncbi:MULTISPECIES: hypothetical protein [unclassified Nocardioides]|uniref:hypothetical protein n=1 Tax=unclassified Nocardioides TaxID=2615069 RepID=UPI000056FEBB|nr:MULTISPECIES: hypothetical protein [unclassified Nocardioides]ABL79677.1 hypothetical protein Noca_0132 [Nocardioides sp. JS614]